MSIIKSRQIYVGGFDKEYFVDEMSASHLINSIRMVRDNIHALEMVDDIYGKKGGIKKSIECLYKDLKVLSKELDGRKGKMRECC